MLIENVENQLFRKVAPFTIRHIKRPDLYTNDPLAERVFDQAGREFQAAPPITLHSPDQLLMAGVWSATRECFIINADGRAMREAVAAAVSQLNECPYCVDVHTAMHASANGGHPLSKKKSANDNSPIDRAYKWALATLEPGSPLLQNPQISAADIPQIFGTAICFHYTNRMVNIFLDRAPMPMPAAGSKFMRAFSRASLRFFGRRIVKLDGEPGDFIMEADDAVLPEEFSWAHSNPHVAGGLLRFSHAAEMAGDEAVPKEVQELVRSHLNTWNGEQVELGRGWLENLVQPLDKKLQPSARLAILAARASWQVDKKIVREFRQFHEGDKALIQVAGWASYAAVKRISGWLIAPTGQDKSSSKERKK